MEQFLDRCRGRVGMAGPPIISPEIFEQARQHLEASMPSSIMSDYLRAAEFILQLFCPPPNADISPYLENAISYIVNTLCSLENATPHQLAVVTESLRYVFESLPNPSLVNPPPMAPDKEESPDKYGLYLFHLLSTQGGITAAYRRYVLPCLNAIYGQIAIEANASSPLRSPGRSLAYDHSLSIRYFLRHANVLPVNIGQFAERPSVSEIDAAFQLIAQDPKCALDRKTIALHKQRVMVAFRHNDQTLQGPRPRWSRSDSTGVGRANFYFHTQLIRPGEDPWDDPDHSVAREIHYAMPRDAFTERECPDEYATSSIATPSELEGNTLAVSIFKRAQAAATAIAQSKRYHWDLATLPLEAYLQFLVKGNPLDPRFALGWLIANTGQDPARLIDLRFTSAAHVESGIGLHVESGSLSLIHRQPTDWIGWKRDKHGNLLRDCLPSSDQIVLALPPEVRCPLAPYLEYRHAIADQLPVDLRSIVFVTLEPPCVPISMDSLDEYLKSFTGRSFPFQLTAASLARSFWHLYGGRLGREDLVLPYIAGRVPFAIKAQMFYVRMTLDRLGKDYSEAAHEFGQALLAEAMALDKRSRSCVFSRALERIFLFRHAHHTPTKPIPLTIPGKAVGSQAVPSADKVRDFLAHAALVLANLSESNDPNKRRQYFNLHMIVTRHQYAFATGLRPVGDARLSIDHFIQTGPDSSYIIFGEKSNARFADLGLIKHSPTAHRIFLSGRDAGLLYLSSLRWRLPAILDDHAALGRPAFFLMDDQDRIVQMLPSLVRKELATVGLSETLIAPLNAPRHYLLTWLFDQKVARPLRDKIARHQHEGQEWFSLLGGTDAHEADEILCDVIETMLSDLGIHPLHFKLRLTL